MKEDVAEQVESIELSTRSNDRDSLRLQLHRLKGAALSGSLPGLATIAAAMERMVADDVEAALLEEKLEELLKEWDEAEKEL